MAHINLMRLAPGFLLKGEFVTVPWGRVLVYGRGCRKIFLNGKSCFINTFLMNFYDPVKEKIANNDVEYGL